MADDKRGRDAQASDADRRQRERAMLEALERREETEPPVEAEILDDIETELGAVAFPATGEEIVAAVGDREVRSVDGSYALDDLLPDTDTETFETPAAVRLRVQRPTIAASMKRIVEAGAGLPKGDLRGSQREAYERTLREMAAIDADDDDEGITAITDWIVERTADKQALPGSRDVRRQAAKICRAEGYEIRDDEWLGV